MSFRAALRPIARNRIIAAARGAIRRFRAGISVRLSRHYFDPGFLGLFVNPFYFARKGLRKQIAELAPRISGVVLDVGCGQQPYRELFQVTEYVGLELDTPENRKRKRAGCFYDGETFPFPEGRFDSVILFEVLEHVFNPDRFVSELFRVLKPTGMMLLTVPMVWDEHEQPYDYARYSSFGLSHLLGKHGFAVEQHRKSVDDVSVIFQLFNAYLYKMLVGKHHHLNPFFMLLFLAPVNVFGAIVASLLPRNPDLYLDNVVLARKPAGD